MRNYLIRVQRVYELSAIIRANSAMEAAEAAESAVHGTGVCLNPETDRGADYPETNILREEIPANWEDSAPDYIVNEDGELEEPEE